MTRKLPIALARLTVGSTLLACLILPLTSQPASACDISYGYKPTLSLDKPHLGLGGKCSTSTSLVGVAIVTALTVAALGIITVRSLKQATAITGGSTNAGQSLSTYLAATALTIPAPPLPPDRHQPR